MKRYLKRRRSSSTRTAPYSAVRNKTCGMILFCMLILLPDPSVSLLTPRLNLSVQRATVRPYSQLKYFMQASDVERADNGPDGSPPFRPLSSSDSTLPAGQSNEKRVMGELNSETSGSVEALKEAEELRLKARKLVAEARALEDELKENQRATSRKEQGDSQELLDRLFNTNRPLTPQAVARIMREERWSVEQAGSVLRRLYEQQQRAAGNPFGGRPETFQLADPANEAPMANHTQAEIVEGHVQCLLNAVAILDKEKLTELGISNSLMIPSNRGNRNSRWSGRGDTALRAQWNEWLRTDQKTSERQIASSQMQLAANKGNTSSVMEDYLRQTLGLGPVADEPKQFNMSRVVERVSLVPLWLPSPLIKYMVASRALLAADDVKTIRERVLPASRFYLTSSESIPSAAIFRGNMRIRPGTDQGSEDGIPLTASVFAEVQDLMEREKLSSRVQLLMMPDPEWKPTRDEREPNPKPVILAIPKEIVPDDSLYGESWWQSFGKKAGVALTFTSTLMYSVGCYALNPNFFEAIVKRQDIAAVGTCLPVFAGVCALAAVHEVAHRAVARWRRIKVGRPVPLPSVQFGNFGCITPLRSFPPDRAALLDFSLSGPLAGQLMSVVLMVLGAIFTVHATPSTLEQFPVVPVSTFKSSFLASSLLTLLAPKVMALPLSQPIPIHPCFMVGFSGLIVSALNMLPIFRLDGGRACSAAMGSRFAGLASASTLLFMLSAALSGSSGVAWTFGAMVLFFQRRQEIPVRDDSTEVDDFRVGTWIASLLTSLLTLAPFPGGPGLL